MPSLDRPSRREALAGTLGLIAAAAAPAWAAQPSPFTLGVASGDPLPDGFVIWTRLAPYPLALDGSGGIRGPIPVRWEVAEDEALSKVVARGTAVADDRYAHSVHVEVSGLRPHRPYWYRFMAMGESSRVGRARTAPAPGQLADRIRFAFASCSHYERGYFSPYRHMAAEQPDVVMFLGDYIYEGSYKLDEADKVVRRHAGPPEVKTLADYRVRYAQYRTDPDLQALHAAAPCLMTWDDHEVQNDYANKWSEHPDYDPAEFLKRRAGAYRAYYEHMPLRARSRPNGPDMRVYDRIGFGELMQVFVLDGRQYRTIQPCALPDSRHGHVAPDSCAERTDPSRTMLGFEQERWLAQGFGASRARWNVVAQDLLIASMLQKDAKTGETGHYTDGWDGYPATRTRMLKAVADSGVKNPVFLGGDIHSFWVTDLKADYADPASRTVATEFVGTSVTSEGPDYERIRSTLPLNPHVKFFDSRPRGHVSVDLTPQRMETRFQVISDRRDPKATVSTLSRWVVEDGRPGALQA